MAEGAFDMRLRWVGAALLLATRALGQEPVVDRAVFAEKQIRQIQETGDVKGAEELEARFASYKLKQTDANWGAFTLVLATTTLERNQLLERKAFVADASLRLQQAGIPQATLLAVLGPTAGESLKDVDTWLKTTDDITAAAQHVGAVSTVSFHTPSSGATVKYETLGQFHRHETATTVAQLTNDATAVMPLGIYVIWSERNGVPTSPVIDVQYRIVTPAPLPINLAEHVTAH
jgi:hypothetical protein